MRFHHFFTLALIGLTAPAFADDIKTYELTLSNHQFSPAEINVPAGKAFAIHVTNKDEQAEEFDSDALGVEKVIAGTSDGVVHVQALDVGKYDFSGEYHSDSAKGVVIAQ